MLVVLVYICWLYDLLFLRFLLFLLFLLLFSQVYEPLTGEYRYYDKFFGRSRREHNIMRAVSDFFDDGTPQRRADLIAPMISQLQQFRDWFEQNETLKLFATSLLIVYEGDRSVADCKLEIRLVDFAHTYSLGPSDCVHDENALFGMRSFFELLHRVPDFMLAHQEANCR